MGQVSRNIIRFFLVLLIQIVLINNPQLSGTIVLPQIYILFILLLPFQTPPWLVITLSFVTGLLMDMTLNTFGIHAFACSTIGFLRNAIHGFLSPRDGYDFNSEPSFADQGVVWFSVYASIMILIHHFVLFFIEKYSWSNFSWSILKVFMSALATLALIILYQLIVRTKKTKSN